jgi:hypothetical protein
MLLVAMCFPCGLQPVLRGLRKRGVGRCAHGLSADVDALVGQVRQLRALHFFFLHEGQNPLLATTSGA